MPEFEKVYMEQRLYERLQEAGHFVDEVMNDIRDDANASMESDHLPFPEVKNYSTEWASITINVTILDENVDAPALLLG